MGLNSKGPILPRTVHPILIIRYSLLIAPVLHYSFYFPLIFVLFAITSIAESIVRKCIPPPPRYVREQDKTIPPGRSSIKTDVVRDLKSTFLVAVSSLLFSELLDNNSICSFGSFVSLRTSVVHLSVTKCVKVGRVNLPRVERDDFWFKYILG